MYYFAVFEKVLKRGLMGPFNTQLGLVLNFYLLGGIPNFRNFQHTVPKIIYVEQMDMGGTKVNLYMQPGTYHQTLR